VSIGVALRWPFPPADAGSARGGACPVFESCDAAALHARGLGPGRKPAGERFGVRRPEPPLWYGEASAAPGSVPHRCH